MGNTENLQYPATFCMTKRNVKANVNIPTTSHIDLKNDKNVKHQGYQQVICYFFVETLGVFEKGLKA